MNGKNSTNAMDHKALSALLSLASKKLGTSPEVLKSQLESGSFDKALSNLPQNQQSRLKQALSDPKTAEKLLSTPQAQSIYRKLQK